MDHHCPASQGRASLQRDGRPADAGGPGVFPRNGFKTFIVSGGGIEFMRPWTERVYGIPPEQVVGSSGKLKLETRNGQPVLVKLAEIDLIDDKEGKPVGIQSRIGRRPIAAFGNSDGDLQMLQWATAGSGDPVRALRPSRRRGAGVRLRSRGEAAEVQRGLGYSTGARLDRGEHEERLESRLPGCEVARKSEIMC